MSAPPPEDGTIERWACDYIASTELAYKLTPPPPPRRWSSDERPRRVAAPGRPPELVVVSRAPKRPRPHALRDPARRAELVHTFFHHELQAAELTLWGVLAFPAAPRALRRGLVRIARDEIRHAGLYASHLESLGARVGAHPVRDWFWQRVPSVRDVRGLLALLGVGLEGANLDHTRRFAELFRAADDEEGARLQELIGVEEIPHVRFAARWLAVLGGGALEFDAWRALLPPPLTPLVLRGRPLDRDKRRRAGLSNAFVDALDRWEPAPSRDA